MTFKTTIKETKWRMPMLKQSVSRTVIHTLDWVEANEIIRNYIKRKYGVTFPKGTEVRAISKSNAMVEPIELRYKDGGWKIVYP